MFSDKHCPAWSFPEALFGHFCPCFRSLQRLQYEKLDQLINCKQLSANLVAVFNADIHPVFYQVSKLDISDMMAGCCSNVRAETLSSVVCDIKSLRQTTAVVVILGLQLGFP